MRPHIARWFNILRLFYFPQIAALPALVAAAVAVGTANLDRNLFGTGDTELEALQRETFGSAGWVIGVAGLAFLVQVFMLVLRFCNIGLINLKINIFLTMVCLLPSRLCVQLYSHTKQYVGIENCSAVTLKRQIFQEDLAECWISSGS